MATSTLTQRVVSSAAPTPNTKSSLVPGRLRLRIDEKWYDLTNWKQHHPGGEQILEHLNGKDATDAFYSLHSNEAVARLNRMASTPVTSADEPVIPELQSFRKWRKQLIQDGWFNRSAFWDYFYLSSVYVYASIGTYLCMTGHPILAILLIGLAMQQAGWVGHDFVHGRGGFCFYAGRATGSFINGFSSSWWSNKHNTHHCYTNHVGIDSDIQNDPVFHLFFPTANNDVSFRRYQHLYFVPVASVIFLSWRIQSVLYAYEKKNYKELAMIALNYVWLYFLPAYVSIAAIFLSGFLVATIVTASHQSEEMFEGSESEMQNREYNFVRCQFESTRDAVTSNFFFEYLWGGMQYQLEHHLFPTMPKYYYRAIAPIVQKWASENNLPYKSESEWDILVRNYETLKHYSQPLSQ